MTPVPSLALPEEGLVHLSPAEGQRALGQRVCTSLRSGKEARTCRTWEALTVFSWGQPRPRGGVGAPGARQGSGSWCWASILSAQEARSPPWVWLKVESDVCNQRSKETLEVRDST